VAKTDSTDAPYAVANEYICSRLGTAIGLPTPPGVVLGGPAGDAAFVSLRFGRKGDKPPPIISEHLAEDEPFVAGGVIAFDCWIGNKDRHTKNIAYVRSPRIPPVVFDHSHALMGYQKGEAVRRLADTIDEPYVGHGCLDAVVKEGSGFGEWAGRIASVPTWLVEEACSVAETTGAASPEEAVRAREFLRHRQTRILEYLKAEATALPNVSWGML
jgi:hypothetical protein